tara:strand:- start:773 stop:925 length:153 start_codon:yes stop_codon:yes gene_type:complete
MWSPWQVPTELSEEERKKWEAIPVKKFWTIMAIIIVTMALLGIVLGFFIA